MAILKAKERNKLPKSEFGIPAERKYPMPDKSHAANAKARATQMSNAGKLSKSAEAKIDAKANKILGEDKKMQNTSTDKSVHQHRAERHLEKAARHKEKVVHHKEMAKESIKKHKQHEKKMSKK